MTLTLPTIHLNGTSARELLAGYSDACVGIHEALAMLRRSSPNGRDYYPQGPEAINTAIREHRAREAKLLEVLRELETLGEHVADAA